MRRGEPHTITQGRKHALLEKDYKVKTLWNCCCEGALVGMPLQARATWALVPGGGAGSTPDPSELWHFGVSPIFLLVTSQQSTTPVYNSILIAISLMYYAIVSRSGLRASTKCQNCKLYCLVNTGIKSPKTNLDKKHSCCM